MGDGQNYGPFLGTLNTRCRTRIGTQEGTNDFDNRPYANSKKALLVPAEHSSRTISEALSLQSAGCLLAVVVGLGFMIGDRHKGSC